MIFVLSSIVLISNLIFYILARRSMRTRRVSIPLFFLCTLLPLGLACRGLVLTHSEEMGLLWSALLAAGWVPLPHLLYELITSMLYLPSEQPDSRPPPRISQGIWLVRLTSALAAVFPLLTPIAAPALGNESIALVLSAAGTMWLVIVLALFLAVLYQLERAFRGATPPQRRIMQVCFTSIGVIAIAECTVLIRAILFRAVPISTIESATIAGMVFAIGIPGSFLRYRLAEQKISVARTIMYSSITLFVAGAALLSIGVAAYLVRIFGFSLSQTSTAIIVSTAAFGLVLGTSSRSMRKKVIRYVNTQFYHRKYDYRDMFFRLARIYRMDEKIGDSIAGFLEQLRFMLTVQEAFVFIKNTESGDFRMFDNVEYSRRSEGKLSGSGSLISALSSIDVDIIAYDQLRNALDGTLTEGERDLFGRCKVTFFSPIRHKRELVGILGISDKRNNFDEEDRVLIRIFCESIGAGIYRNRLLQDQIESKQFESFSRIASFIIHDIKNQVSTLSLIVRNAQTNIGNPEFQKSMLRSLTTCTGGLQSLIEKLRSPLKQEKGGITASCNINAVVREIFDSTALPASPGVTADCRLGPAGQAAIDGTTLAHIVKNLIVNALEAMNYSGSLVVQTGTTSELPESIQLRIGGERSRSSNCPNFITVEDNGPGMEADFVETRLFRPFMSTKDKGIGIGLYQCKTVIERSGGRLVCSSKPGQGTVFCILI